VEAGDRPSISLARVAIRSDGALEDSIAPEATRMLNGDDTLEDNVASEATRIPKEMIR